jgi:hypothetical protein
MDHILLPSSWARLPSIPLLCAERLEHLDGPGEFSEYPESRDVDIRLLGGGNYGEPDRETKLTAAFLQEWLFFYFLKRTIGVDIDIDWSDFCTDTESGSRFITTHSLPRKYLPLWRNMLQRGGGSDIDVRECLERASSCTTLLLDEAGKPKTSLGLTDDAQYIILSIMVLHSTIYSEFVTFVSQDKFHIYRMYLCGVKTVIPFVLKQRLLDCGFCNYDIANLEATEDILTILYLSCMHRAQKVLERDHSTCRSDFCNILQIDGSSYSTKHRAESCRCSALPADTRGLLLEGGMPVIQIPDVFDSQNATEPYLHVINGTGDKSTPYVAISHVWADGLGNPYGNSLPRCQLKRLRDILKKFHQIVNNPFNNTHPMIIIDGESSEEIRDNCPAGWIDTLCVPRPPPTASESVRNDMENCRQLAKNVEHLNPD